MAGSFAKISFHGAVLDTRILDKITAELKPKARNIVEKYGWTVASHAASVHPWKLQTGTLTGSVLSESKMTGDLTFTIVGGTEYAIFLEFGTSKMAAYPFFIPAIEYWKDKFLSAFSELFK